MPKTSFTGIWHFAHGSFRPWLLCIPGNRPVRQASQWNSGSSVDALHTLWALHVLVHYLWFSPADASSWSFSLSVSCFFSSALKSPFVILSLSTYKHKDGQDITQWCKPPQRGEFIGACDDTCLAPDLSEKNVIFHWFDTASSRIGPFMQTVVFKEVVSQRSNYASANEGRSPTLLIKHIICWMCQPQRSYDILGSSGDGNLATEPQCITSMVGFHTWLSCS